MMATKCFDEVVVMGLEDTVKFLDLIVKRIDNYKEAPEVQQSMMAKHWELMTVLQQRKSTDPKYSQKYAEHYNWRKERLGVEYL